MQFAEWSKDLFDDYRYKIIYGGRGSGKSYTVADYLLVSSLQDTGTYLCSREIQKAIKDSVHALLCQRISELNLSHLFTITKDEIKNIYGVKFIFAGLRFNVDSIKSVPNIRKLWIEEGDLLSLNSWRTIKPTIREDNSEIIITFNPKNKDDVLYNEFVLNNTHANALVKCITFKDNPFFNDVSEQERLHDLKTLSHNIYSHIWLGDVLEITEAQVFGGRYSVSDFEDPDTSEVYYGGDFGFSIDPLACVRLMIFDNCLYITHEAYKVGVENRDISSYVKDRVIGIEDKVSRWDSSRPDTISQIKNDGLSKATACKKGAGSVIDGIEFIRSFNHIYIHERCPNTAKEFKLYSYQTDRSGDIVPNKNPVDRFNHAIDATRYALEPLSKMNKKKIGLIADML